MKIVHEIYNEPQVVISGKSRHPKTNDWFVDILISCSEQDAQPEENIHIEGSAKQVLLTFKKIIKIIEDLDRTRTLQYMRLSKGFVG